MSYYPVWYFPSGATPALNPGEADDLLGAIVEHFRAQPELSVISGGIFLDQAGDRSSLPYTIVTEAGATLDLATSSSAVHDTRIRFTVYATDLNAAGTYGNLIANAFLGRDFAWAGGKASPFVRHDRKHRKDKGHTQATQKVWHMELEFQTRVRTN